MPATAPPPERVGIGWRHPHYAELLQTWPALDFIEVHSENFFGDGGAALAVLEQARAHYPLSLHGVGLGLGSATGVDEWHLQRLDALVRRTQPQWVSDHACFARAPWGGALHHASDLLPIPFNTEALQVLAANVQRVQDRLRRPLLVENLSAYLLPAGSDRSEAEFLGELTRRTGCGLLLDVNNLYVNARNQGLADPLAACLQQVQALDTDAVGEIHVAGHCVLDDIVIDDHGSAVSEPVWDLLRAAHARWPQAVVLVEWDTDVPPLSVLLGEAGRARAVMDGPA